MIGASFRVRYLIYFALPHRHKENGMRKTVESNGCMTLKVELIQTTIARTNIVPKIGRNSSCPCGAGKKLMHRCEDFSHKAP